jgi:hypothetical protein
VKGERQDAKDAKAGGEDKARELAADERGFARINSKAVFFAWSDPRSSACIRG